MRGYIALISARFRVLLQYRAAALAGLFTQVFFGLFMVMIYEAFYRYSRQPQPMTYAQTVTYVWLGQALLAMFPWNVDADLRTLIRSGDVAYELLRPLDLYNAWFCRTLAWRTAPTILRAVPMVILAMLFFGMQPPASLAAAGAFAVSIAGSLLLGCALTLLMDISLFWTVSGDGISQLVPGLVLLLSGMEVPLPLYPAWAQPILNALPFRGLIDIPFRLYTGNLPASQLLPLLAQQLGWTAVLVLAGRWLLTLGRRRLIVQGG
jgi:ABC-2 type transport system permease protein